MKSQLIVTLILVLFLTACGGQPASNPTPLPSTETPTSSNPPTAAPASPTAEAATATSAGSSACTDAAAFVSDVTIPDYTHFDAKETFTKTWRIKNSGTCSWTSGYTAVYSSGDHLSTSTTIPLSATAPNATVDISANMTAPSADGKYKIFYQIHNAAGQPIPVDDGDTIWAIITVGKIIVPPSPTPASTSSTSGGTTSAPAGCVTKGNTDFVAQTVALINNARTTNGLPALTTNPQLTQAAQAHSVDMACSGSLSHTGTDGSTTATRIAAAGYNASISRENIYAQPPQYGGNAQAAVDWWMSDQIHRDAILNAQVTEIGAGYAYYSGSPLGGYFTVDFAAP